MSAGGSRAGRRRRSARSDVLVNNAGVEFGGPVPRHEPGAELEAIVAVNLLAVMDLTRLLLPGMLERRRGHVVNIASLAGKLHPPLLGVLRGDQARRGRVHARAAGRASDRSRSASRRSVPVFVGRVGMYGRLEDRHRGRLEPDGTHPAGARGRGGRPRDPARTSAEVDRRPARPFTAADPPERDRPGAPAPAWRSQPIRESLERIRRPASATTPASPRRRGLASVPAAVRRICFNRWTRERRWS